MPKKIPYQVSRFQVLREVRQLLRNPIPILGHHLRESGGIYRSYLGARQVTLIDQPEAIAHILQSNHRNYRKPPKTYGAIAEFLGNGLLTSEGKRWRTHRKMIQPGFNPKRIVALGESMVQETEKKLDEIAAKNDEPIDWAFETVGLTSKIIGRALFSDQLTAGQIEHARKTIAEASKIIVRDVRAPFLKWTSKLTGKRKRVLSDLIEIRSQLLAHVKARNNSPREFDDLIQMLVEARFDDTGAPLGPDDLLDEALTFYVAGHETSSHALSWFVYELGQRPEIQTQVREEIESVCGGRHTTVEDLPHMPLLDSALRETLRLHPPGWIVDREAIEADEVLGYEIPKGMLVALCIFSLHRRSDLWDRPDEFRLDRFLKPNDIPEGAWLPFGAGPRKCIGQHFAMMEMNLVAAQLLKRFEFEVINAAEIGEKAMVTLGMDRPLQTQFRSNRVGS